MKPAVTRADSQLDHSAARVIAVLIALVALGLVAWLVYVDNREDPAVSACIKQRTVEIERARDQGSLPPEAAQRFLAKVAESCAAQHDGDR